MTRTAIVLAGGGAKGDFEVGVLHYLYSTGIRPDVLCTTSVGSVNGLKLAEGETGPDRGLSGLTAMWLAMTDYTGFFAEADWLLGQSTPIRWFRQFALDFAAANPTPTEDALTVNPALTALRLAEAEAVAARRDAIGVQRELAGAEALAGLALGSSLLLPAPIGPLATAGLGGSLALLASADLDALNEALRAPSIFTLNPIEALARKNIDRQAITDWAAAGGRLRMATVSLESGGLRYVCETGEVLERDGTPVTELAPGPAPECQPLADRLAELDGEIAAAEDQLIGEIHHDGLLNRKITRLGLERDGVRKALNACQASHRQAVPVLVDLITGMLASASIPTFFPPQLLAGQHHVDGGVRAVLPSEVALAQDVDRVIAVQASKRDVDHLDGADLNLYTIALRSLMDIAINEISLRDAHPPAGFGGRQVTVIEPRVDIHTVFTMYPALVRQRMAYGWMCAADTLAPPPDPASAQRARDLADRISVVRYGAARLECWLGGHPVPPMMVTMPRPGAGERTAVANMLAEMKTEIPTLVAERARLGAGLPAGATDWDDPALWSFGTEAHPWGKEPADGAGFVSQSVPLSLPAGATAAVSVTMRNEGSTTWDPAAGYRLGSQEPQDNTAWGTSRVALGNPVHPGDTATFAFTITTPTIPGTALFCWRMLQEGVRWFGDTSTAVPVAVTPAGEPAICATLRSRIAEIDVEVERLEAQLIGEIHHDGPLNRKITQLGLERERDVTAMRDGGCTM
jgi:NTE family protein